jgi:hypothetical protein
LPQDHQNALPVMVRQLGVAALWLARFNKAFAPRRSRSLRR